MLLLPSTLADPSGGSRPHQPFILVQSSASQTCLPVLRSLIQPTKRPARTLLFCFLYPPSSLITDRRNLSIDSEVFDYTERVPGYDEIHGSCEEILTTVCSVPTGSLHVIIDSVDTIATDLASDSQTYKFVKSLLALVTSRSQPSALILHLLPCTLLPILTQTRLSAPLTHIIAHPPSLLTHLASSYFAPPPSIGLAEKFWTVFIPVSERAHESEAFVYGPEGTGTCSGGGANLREFVVELIIRKVAEDGHKRGIERTIEAWDGIGPECLQKLDSLKSIWSSKLVDATPLETTQSMSFNLKLTSSQEKSRAQVLLPYAHQGRPIPSALMGGAILYEPDSADDIDDDDPDEDLDI